MAYMPPVIMQYIECRIMCGTDTIEVTGNRFFPIDFTELIGFFNGTFCDSIFPGYIRTFFVPLNTWRCQVAILIDDVCAIFFDRINTLLCHIGFYFGIYIL